MFKHVKQESSTEDDEKQRDRDCKPFEIVSIIGRQSTVIMILVHNSENDLAEELGNDKIKTSDKSLIPFILSSCVPWFEEELPTIGIA
jgi:hypothetical protein